MSNLMWRSMELAPKDGKPILAMCQHDADPYCLEDGKLTPYGAACENFVHAEDGVHLVVWKDGYEECDYTMGSTYFVPGCWFVHGYQEVAANPVAWMPVPPYPGEPESPPMRWQAFDPAMLRAQEWDQQHVVVELTSGVVLFGRVIFGECIGYDPHADRYNDPIEEKTIRHILRVNNP